MLDAMREVLLAAVVGPCPWRGGAVVRIIHRGCADILRRAHVVERLAMTVVLLGSRQVLLRAFNLVVEVCVGQVEG